jgi:thioredoxin reductase
VVWTSDVARPRLLALSALGAAAGASVVLAGQRTPLSVERPIARPHAKLACSACHGTESPTADVGAACTSCHGPGHASARPAHRALAVKGELGCKTCHGQHAGGQGITFESDAVIRWTAGREVALPRASGGISSGTTVPLVAVSACAKCHDPSRASDPIAACIPASVRAGGAVTGVAAQCFDEHVKTGEARASSSGPCAPQHRSARFVAWDAARDIAATTPWVSPAASGAAPWPPALGALAGALVLGAAGTRLRRRAPVPPTAPIAPPARKRLPTIDPQTCLGCYACVDACPFDVLAVEKYVAVVVRPNECCGVVLCEQVCPNGSLRIDEGDVIPGRPPTTEDLESRDVPGLYIAGDLTGLPLIKNAINQGARAVDHVAKTMRRRPGAIDVVVIGAGPAGLSAALRAKQRGLSCVVLEQATAAASIKSFPRDKIVHDPPLDLPVEGELWLKEATKEELVAQWTRIIRARALDVREGHRVVDLVPKDGGFDVRTATGTGADGEPEFRASRVVVAIGRRGTPRPLEAEIEPGLEDRVAYALADARSFEGKRVLVVGLGDAAMEAALAISRQPGTEVAISYRGARFARGKTRNIREVERAMEERRLKILFETLPVAVRRAGVTLRRTGLHGGHLTVAADAVLVLIGGIPSWDLLARAGIRPPEIIRRPDT